MFRVLVVMYISQKFDWSRYKSTGVNSLVPTLHCVGLCQRKVHILFFKHFCTIKRCKCFRDNIRGIIFITQMQSFVLNTFNCLLQLESYCLISMVCFENIITTFYNIVENIKCNIVYSYYIHR